MAIDESQNTHAPPAAGQDSKQHEPFGLLAEDRPMLPGESKPPPADLALAKKTTGERFYDILQFAIGQVSILFFTAVIAFITRYGKDKYGPVPNVFKKFQEKLQDKIMHNNVYPVAEKSERMQRFAGAFASTMVLFHGGNLFAPIMKVMENNRLRIVNYANKRWGKPGELEAGEERLKDLPKQSWLDIIKGRLIAFALVFGSFSVADGLLGKDKETGKFKFDKYEDYFGRKMAGLTKSGKDISRAPLTQELTASQQAHPFYRFSKILALDLYATSAAIILWNSVSRLSARKRLTQAEQKDEASAASMLQEKPTKNVSAHSAHTDHKEKWQDKNQPSGKASFAEREGNESKTHIARATENTTTPEPALR